MMVMKCDIYDATKSYNFKTQISHLQLNGTALPFSGKYVHL